VSCTTNFFNQNEEYVFSYIMPMKNIVFSIATTYKSLKDTNYQKVQKNIVDYIEKKWWVNKDRGTLKSKTLASMLREVLKGFKIFKIKNKVKVINLQPLSIPK